MASNYESRKLSLERRRKLTEALMAKSIESQPQGQMIGPHYLAPSLGQSLAPALQMLASGFASSKLDKEEGELKAERQKELASVMADIQRKQQAGDSSWMYDPNVLGDPTLSEYSKEAFKQQVKPEKFSYGSGVGPDGKPMLLARGERGTVKPTDYAPVPKISTSYGMGYNTLTGEPTGRIATPPDRSTNVTVNAQTLLPEAEKKKYQKVGELVGGRQVEQLLERRQQVVKDYETAVLLEKTATEGMATGQLAPLGVFLGQLGSSVGWQADPRLVTAERYDASIERAVSDMIMSDPKGITQQEAERFAKSWAPLTGTPEGRIKIINDVKELRRREFEKIDQATQRLSEDDPGLFEIMQSDPAMYMKLPERGAPATAGPGGASPASPAGAPQIKSDADYDALPPGSEYIDPSGKRRRKQ